MQNSRYYKTDHISPAMLDIALNILVSDLEFRQAREVEKDFIAPNGKRYILTLRKDG